MSPPFTSAIEANEWLEKKKPDFVVVCATNTVTETIMKQLLESLPEGIILDVAGKFEEELSGKWLEIGLNGFIFNGQDNIEKLTEIQNNWKGDKNNEKA